MLKEYEKSITQLNELEDVRLEIIRYKMRWKDPEKRREYQRAYREKNKERILKQKRIWDKKYNATHKE